MGTCGNFNSYCFRVLKTMTEPLGPRDPSYFKIFSGLLDLVSTLVELPIRCTALLDTGF